MDGSDYQSDRLPLVLDRACVDLTVLVPSSLPPVAEAMADRGILAGLPLGEFYPELSQCLLVCGTEKHSDEDIERYLMELGVVLSSLEQKT